MYLLIIKTIRCNYIDNSSNCTYKITLFNSTLTTLLVHHSYILCINWFLSMLFLYCDSTTSILPHLISVSRAILCEVKISSFFGSSTLRVIVVGVWFSPWSSLSLFSLFSSGFSFTFFFSITSSSSRQSGKTKG